MKKTHYDWQKRLLNDITYMIIDATNSTYLFSTKKEVENKIKSFPSYLSHKIYEKVNSKNKKNFINGALLHGLDHPAIIGDFQTCLKNTFTPSHLLRHQTLFGEI